VVPGEALPAKDAEPPDDPDGPGRVALHDHGLEHVGQDDEITLRAGGPVEHHPLVRAVRAAQEPTREPIGEASSVRQRLVTHGPPSDVELHAGRPRGGIRLGLKDRAGACNPPLVDSGADRMIDLYEQYLAEALVSIQAQAALVEVLRESSQSARRRIRH
jgi:hypothetical protein